MPTHRRKRSAGISNARGFSAAAFAGIVGLPDPGHGPRLHDGGLRQFAHQFNERFDQLAASRRPEFRAFARTERYFAAPLR